MNRFTFLLVALFATLTAIAQTKFYVYQKVGGVIECEISNTDSISFTAPIITDHCGNTYPIVTIGTQVWMAESLKCDKYDTQSEAYNASWLTNNTIPTTSENYTYTPYYADASDKSKWDYYSKTAYSVNLTDAQVSKLGYLYNWAAAVGVEDGDQYGTTPFTGNCQGICPNGWHIPTKTEWKTLQDYIEETQSKGSYTASKHLKTTSGWYDDNNPAKYPQGLDTYGFAALPAGGADGSGVNGVGYGNDFWTATPYEIDNYSAYYCGLYYNNDYLSIYGTSKSYAQSVRCLRN